MPTGRPQPPARSRRRQARQRKLGLVGLLALATGLALQAPSLARWDLNTAWEVEKHLQDFIKTLPGGASVQPPRLFLYRGASYSKACTDASEIRSPVYCSGDNTVYLEMGLGDQKSRQYGDFGALSIVSHEFGHAYLMQTGQHHEGKTGELDADRFAGAFARYAQAKGLLEPGDLQEAQQTFHSVGDPYVDAPDHHGLPEERLAAFNRGHTEGFVGQPGSGTTVTPAGADPAPAPTPTPSTPVPAPVPQAPSGSQPALAVLGLGLGMIVAILIGAALVVMIRRAAEDDA